MSATPMSSVLLRPQERPLQPPSRSNKFEACPDISSGGGERQSYSVYGLGVGCGQQDLLTNQVWGMTEREVKVNPRLFF